MSDLLSPDDQAVLRQARQLNAKPSVPSYSSLKLKNSAKEVEGLTRGHFFIESFDGENKQFHTLGANPEVIILHRAYTYSYYDEDAGLVAWTSEIQGFDDSDFCVLYAKKDGKAEIRYEGGYPGLKRFMAEKYVVTMPSGKEKKLMKFQNLLYVLYKNQVYRMFVSNASAAGIAPGEKAPDFKKPQLLSLQHFIDTTRGAQMDAALCEFACTLGSKFINDAEQPYHIMTFTNAGKNDLLPDTIGYYRTLLTDMQHVRKDMQERAKVDELRQEVDLSSVAIETFAV